MPNYTFRCDEGHELVLLVPMGERDNPIPCPLCRCPCHHPEGLNSQLRRLVDAPTLMIHALPDGTRRFDDIRKQRDKDREAKAKADAKRIAAKKLTA